MKFREKKVEKCWVGESQKTCYPTKEEAEVAAQVATHDYGAPELAVYKCEFGDHWHLSSKNGKAHIASCVILLIIVGILLAGFLNRDFLRDYYMAVSYEPSSEMAEIREKINLTENGEFIFNASKPKLDSQNDFNEHCRTVASETAVLGCYTNKTIYIYNIESAELDGIREVTAAHELLHAVYARTDETKKADLQPILDQVYKENVEILGDDLELYADLERDEEIYVRAGTEVADLPEVLEKHYAEIFKDQDKIVAYYNNYESVFRNLKIELDSLTAEMDNLSVQIEDKEAEYEVKLELLSSKITEFNNCAMTAGCFANEAEFYNRRAELLNEQENLDAFYDGISDLIDTYNSKVETYNAGVLRNEELNKLINSNQKPEKVGI